jgi:nucleoside-diphosphate-sugar epimerase
LVLGGTQFVGHALTVEAVQRNWDVTTFNRGLSGNDVAGVHILRGDRSDLADLLQLSSAGPWDAVVDTSGYVPSNVLMVARTLEQYAGHYAFMSTVSVYRDWPVKPLTDESAVLECPPNADADFGEDVEDGPTRYGYQKSGCEAAVRAAFGEGRATILRPGVVLGPREYVGRLPWWLHRVAAGGEVIAPGMPERTVQPVDVRDLARFTLDCLEGGFSGNFNVTAPIDRATFGQLLDACAVATGAAATFRWIPDERLIELGVRQWSEMPLWRTFPGVWQVASDGAERLGLNCRSITSTVIDTWQWLTQSAPSRRNERSGEIGLSPDRERAILRGLGL